MTLINDITSILDPSGLLQTSIDTAALEGLDWTPCESAHTQPNNDICGGDASYQQITLCGLSFACCSNHRDSKRALPAHAICDICGRLTCDDYTFIPLGDI